MEIGFLFNRKTLKMLAGALFTILVAWFFYHLGQDTIKPRYYSSENVLIANSIKGNNDLRIFWNNKLIKNATNVKVAIWNEGSKYIDQKSISKDFPVEIAPVGEVNILSVIELKKSRPEIEFKTEFHENNGRRDRVFVSIANDEVLEKNDGVLLQILFEGDTKSDWLVNGRIKGAPQGFQKKSFKYFTFISKWKFFPLILFLGGSFLMGIISSFEWKKKNYELPFFKRWAGIFFYSAMLLLLFFLLKEPLSYIFSPSWLN